MTKYKSFYLTSSGALVYKFTGNVYRGQYMLKAMKNGNYTVYNAKTGRKIGQTGRSVTKKQLEKIESKDKRRVKRQEAKLRQVEKRIREYEMLHQDDYSRNDREDEYSYEDENEDNEDDEIKHQEDYYDEMVNFYEPFFHYIPPGTLRHVASTINFTLIINRLVTQGYITKARGGELLQKYNSGNNSDQTDLWNLMKSEFPPNEYRNVWNTP